MTELRTSSRAMLLAPDAHGALLRMARLSGAGADWPKPDPQLAAACLAIVNQERQAAGLGQLGVIQTLQAAAEFEARWMAQFNIMSHDNQAEPGYPAQTWFQRLSSFGYPSPLASENIAAGYPSARAVVDAWLASPGHRANLLATWATSTGLAVAPAANGYLYWAQDFGVGGEPVPVPSPQKTDLDRWQAEALPELAIATGTYKAWRKQHKNDEARDFDRFLKDPTGPIPTPTTPTGKFLVASARIYANR